MTTENAIRDLIEAAVPFEEDLIAARHGARAERHAAATEDRAATLFAERFERRFLYCHDQGSWFEWAGSHWRRETTGLVFDHCRLIARELSEGEPPARQATIRKTAFCRGVEAFLKNDRLFAVTADAFDRDPFLLGTPGGTVDLKTGMLRPATAADRITRITAVTPAAFADCPRWLAFLDQATGGDAELVRFLQAWCGYALTGDTREQALIFVYGPGGNGKSVFLNVLTGILNDYAATSSMDTFTASWSERHSTEIAMLRGARLVTASETEEGRAWAEARIKQMTGGDPVTARFMRQDNFTFTPSFKLTIVGNHRPTLHSVDDAMRRRFNVIPFTYRPAKPDPALDQALKREWRGILRWMIDGCLVWQRTGLIRPRIVVAETAAYFAEQDLLGQWLEESCDVEIGNPYKSETSGRLFASYSAFVTAAGERPGARKAFSEQMQRRGFEAYRGTEGVRNYRGIRLRIVEDQRFGWK